MTRIAAIILGAGQGARFAASGGAEASKLVAEWRGKALVRHVAEAALGSLARPVIVVTGHARREVEAALAGLAVSFVDNPDYAQGMAGSLSTGISACPDDASGAIILLGDMPQISSALIARLIAAHRANPQALAIVPAHKGRRGNPVLLARRLFGEVAALQGDQGARRILDGLGGGVIELESADAAIAGDIDTKESLQDLRRL